METKSLNFGEKVIYGFGDLGGNFLAIFIGAFIMIYLTNTIGLNPGVIGTLMLVARVFDGITDVAFGTLIDHTHSKMGKARPWMLWSAFLCTIGIIAVFSVPVTWGKTAQYIFFFVTYVLTNAFFYTANNIAYSTLAALITRDSEERVQLGTARYVCATIAIMIILSVTVPLVTALGGGTGGWQKAALIYAVIFLVLNLICVFFLKELPEEDYEKQENGEVQKNSLTLGETIKTLVTSKEFLLILGVYLALYLWTGSISSLGTYYMTYVVGNASMLGVFSTIQSLAMMAALLFNPSLVKKFGTFITVTRALILSIVMAIVFALAVFSQNLYFLFAAEALLNLTVGPVMGVLSATVADIGTYIFMKKGVHVEGALFSCSSVGIKVGSGVGGALVGWALALSGFNGALEVQPQSAIFMMKLVFAVLPIIVYVITFLCFSKLNMEKKLKEVVK